jgi:hypothetical protein
MFYCAPLAISEIGYNIIFIIGKTATAFRKRLGHPVFTTLDFATTFVFTEEGREPCV